MSGPASFPTTILGQNSTTATAGSGQTVDTSVPIINFVNGTEVVNRMLGNGVLEIGGSSITTGSTYLNEVGGQAWDPNDPTHYPDNKLAFRAAFAATTQGPISSTPAQVVLGTGLYYTSEPVWMPHSGDIMTGQGQYSTSLVASSNVPGVVNTGAPGFSGPVIIAGPITQPITYGPSLYSNGTRSLKLDVPTSTQLILTDCQALNTFNGAAKLTVDGRVKFVDHTHQGAITASSGIKILDPLTNTAVICFMISVQDFGSGPFLQGRITTVNNGSVVLNAATGLLSDGVTYDFSLDYDGSSCHLFLNGVSIASASCSGNIVQKPEEGVTIGVPGSEWTGVDVNSPVNAYVEGVRFTIGNCLHPGGTSYTPSNNIPTATVNETYAIYNFDQGDPYNVNCPWVQAGQVFTGNHSQPSVIHYARMPGGFNGPRNLKYMSVGGGFYGNTPVVWYGCFESLIKEVGIYGGVFGLVHWDGASFYSRHEDLYVFGQSKIGYMASPYTSINVTVVAGVIGAMIAAGTLHNLNIQPGVGATGTIPCVLGAMNFGDDFSSVSLHQFSSDAEGGTFTDMPASLVIARCNVRTYSCFFATNGASPSAPGVLLCQGQPSQGWTDYGSSFGQDDNQTSGRIECVSGMSYTVPIEFNAVPLLSGVNVPWTTSPEINLIKFNYNGTATKDGGMTYVSNYVLTSPNSTQYRVKVANDGTLSTEAA
jgi:hypothetical protein